ncbi:MAG: hypothetical protein AAF629_34345 [Chloroflexota bacterium]
MTIAQLIDEISNPNDLDLILATISDQLQARDVTLETLFQELKEERERVKQQEAKNQLALALLDEWLLEPDEFDNEWWDEFEQELQENRFSFAKA